MKKPLSVQEVLERMTDDSLGKTLFPGADSSFHTLPLPALIPLLENFDWRISRHARRVHVKLYQNDGQFVWEAGSSTLARALAMALIISRGGFV